MKKEQLLLVVCAVIAVLFIWMNLGLYESVSATDLSKGRDVPTTANIDFDLRSGLEGTPTGRNTFQPVIREKRGELPSLAGPEPLAPTWIRPLAWPPAPSASWGRQRTTLVRVKPPEDEGADDSGETGDTGEDDVPDDEDPFKEKPLRDMTKVAQIVRRDGSGQIPVVVEGRGAFAGQSEWKILEAWPNVDVVVQELNGDGTVRGTWLGNPDNDGLKPYSQFVPSRSIENEYHEERIRRGVRETDRGALMELAAWCLESLSETYGIDAVKKGVATYEKAFAIKRDAALTRALGAAYRAAYDPEGEVGTYLRFLETEAREVPILREAAAALDHAGLRGPARKLWEEAAAGGDLGAYLGLGRNQLAAGEVDAALASFRRVQSGGDRAQLAGAYAGECAAQIARGDFAAAAAAGVKAAQNTSSDELALATGGAAHYYNADFAAAEAVLKNAAAVAPAYESRPRTNLGFVLLAKGDLAGARAVFEASLAADALNFVNPHVGLGCIYQREGRSSQASDEFNTALRADPENSWILLRLATMKLEDGVPKDALDLAKQALALASGSVEALRVAGVAADRLGQTDVALEYLGRAADKDAGNARIIHEYAMALLNGGQVDQAVAFLEEATRVGTGAARRDGDCLVLYAFALYRARSGLDAVSDAITRAGRAELTDATKEYLREMRAKIAEWDATRIWTDEFDRQPAERLINGWDEDDDRLGVKIRCDGATAIFKGSQRGQADPRKGTSMSRDGDLKGFVKSAAVFKRVSADTELVLNVYTGGLAPRPGADEESGSRRRNTTSSEIGLVVDRESKLWIWATTQSGRSRTKTGLKAFAVLGADGKQQLYPAGDDWHEVVIERTDDLKGKFEVRLDGETVTAKGVDEADEAVTSFTVGGLAAKSGKVYTLAVTTDADRGTDIEVRIDSVELTRKID